MSVLLYAENTEGKFKKGVFELASYSKALAEAVSTSVVAVAMGAISDDELQKLGQYGVNKVVHVSNSSLANFDPKIYTDALTQCITKEQASIVVFQNNYNGHALSPRVAVRTKAALVAGTVGLPSSTAPFVIRKKVYSGKAFADVELNAEVKILTLSANSFQVTESPTEIEIEKAELELTSSKLRVESIDRVQGKVPVTEAEMIVSGGRGLKGPENWHLVEDLAELLGASTACSKPVADIEWRPHEEHVGQTGKFVSPNLYVAIGISGAIQHLAGISSSKVIVAVNSDPEAPIFEAADYGIVGDAFEVMPKFTEAVRKIKNS
jgi:electron transfer flavoprotein alpha subunit